MQLMRWLMNKPSEPNTIVGNQVKCFQLFMISIFKKMVVGIWIERFTSIDEPTNDNSI